uniref:TonB-dependent receptor n=1 Tax=Chlorobium phaeobacteroides (strain BS1) TaxID=331678 RepID=B3ENM0_CHLPB
MDTKHYQAFPRVRLLLAVFLLTIMLTPLPAWAASPGSVKGTITDKTDGEGIIGASAMLENTTLGSASDVEGNYTISNIPAGTYRLKVNAIGYAPFFQTISVKTGETATINPQLEQTTVMASEIVVGAALYEQDRLEVPVTVSVVTDEKIKEEPNPTLDQVVENVPGVVVNRAGGYGSSTVQIRGSNTFQGGAIGTRVQGLYDGFPINTPVTGEVVWTNVNMNAADKVEVLKGAAATLYGSGAMGGVINVFGSLPDKFEVKAGASGGFYDDPPSSDKSEYYKDNTPWFWNTYVGIGDKRGDLNYNLLYTHADDDGYKETSQSLLNDVKLKARYDIDANQYIQLSSYYNATEGGYPTTWSFDNLILAETLVPHPEYAYDATTITSFAPWFPPTGITTPKSVYTDDTIERKNSLVGLNYVNLFSDDLSLDTRLYYTYNSSRINYNNTDADQTYATGVTREPGEFNQDKSNRYGAGVKLDFRASDQHRLLFGIDGNIVDVQSTQYTAELPAKNEFNDIQEKNLALFVQDEFKMTDKLTALLSVRYDWSGIDADEVSYVDYSLPVTVFVPGVGPVNTYPFTSTAEIENSSVDAISPRVALNYKATDDMSFRASWGRSFRAPTLAERFVRDAGLWGGNPNPALDKESMTAYEIGMYKVFSDRVSFDIAAYMNNYDNLIESVFLFNSADERYFFFENFRKARIWGIETSLNLKPVDELSLNLGYSYMNAKIVDYEPNVPPISIDNNPDPEWLPMRPEHTASISATWKATDRLTLNTTGRYVSEYKAVNAYTDPDGENYPGGFIVFNAGGKYKITDNLTGSFLCRNIANEQYEEAEWYRAPGRSFLLGLDFVY